MPIPIYQVDAFTAELFGGNPAAVCLLEQWLPEEIMQDIAMENNLSETAFLVPKPDHYEIRWFTPAVEVRLCGHATLASAQVLFEFYHPQQQELVFSSKSGLLTVTKDNNHLTLDFPADEPQQSTAPQGLEQALGITAEVVYKGATDYLVLLKHQAALESLSPDFQKLAQVKARGIIVTAPGDEYDFVSRFFGPASGINEDPVTGSAHCTLAPYWHQKLNKNPLRAYQCSARGGEVICTIKGSRVLLTGQAQLYMKGQLLLN